MVSIGRRSYSSKNPPRRVAATQFPDEPNAVLVSNSVDLRSCSVGRLKAVLQTLRYYKQLPGFNHPFCVPEFCDD